MRLYPKIFLITFIFYIIPSILLMYFSVDKSIEEADNILNARLHKRYKEFEFNLENLRDEYFIKAKELIDSEKTSYLYESFNNVKFVSKMEEVDDDVKEKLKKELIVSNLRISKNLIEILLKLPIKDKIKRSIEGYIELKKNINGNEYLKYFSSSTSEITAIYSPYNSEDILIGNIYDVYGQKKIR